MTIDSTTFRQVAGSFASGVTVVTVASQDGFQGMTATAFCSLSLNPTLILICLDRNSRTLSGVRKSQDFNINILGSDQEHLSKLFSTRSNDRSSLENIRYGLSASGLPVFEDAAAYLECECINLLDGGDHVIVVGKVKDAVTRGDVEPLMYFRGSYRRLAPIAS